MIGAIWNSANVTGLLPVIIRIQLQLKYYSFNHTKTYQTNFYSLSN